MARREAEGLNVQQIMDLHRTEFRDEEARTFENRRLSPRLLLLVWVGAIVLSWTAVIWLAVLVGRLVS